MRINNGRYECINCGAALDIPLVEDPRVMIRAASGAANVRTLMVNGEVIHSCQICTDRQEVRTRLAQARSRAAELQAKARSIMPN